MASPQSGGATLWARQTIESEIFYNKPDKWFKIWFYLVNKANHKDNKRFKRGQCFMKYDWIADATGANRNQIKHCIEWLKSATQIATQKATRGFIITICKYNTYQNLKNYKSHTKSHTKRNIKGTQKEHKSHTINKNDKNDKNDNISTLSAKAENTAKKLNSIQILVEHYKRLKKYDKLPNWDKEHFARATASAKRILSQTAGDEAQACKAITEVGKYCESERLSWTIETIVKMFPDWKLGQLKSSYSKPQQTPKIKSHSQPYPEGKVI